MFDWRPQDSGRGDSKSGCHRQPMKESSPSKLPGLVESE